MERGRFRLPSCRGALGAAVKEAALDRHRKRALEAILMVSEDPVPPKILAQLLETSAASVDAAAEELAEEYAERGFVLVRVAGGYRLQSHPEFYEYVESYLSASNSLRLSTAAMETLSIVAYNQPVSRAQIADIRGVKADAVIRTLQRRGLVEPAGVDPGPGNAVLFGTTQLFLESLGIDSISELPDLGQFVPEVEVTEALESVLRGDPSPKSW